MDIKYRAWDKARNEMYYPAMLTRKYIRNKDENSGMYISRYTGDNPEDSILMQFSGLIDVNGNDAYIGDIIEFATTEGKVLTHIIEWSDEWCCLCIGQFPYYRLHESGFIQPSKLVFNILGNKYSNPELLNKVIK